MISPLFEGFEAYFDYYFSRYSIVIGLDMLEDLSDNKHRHLVLYVR